MFQTGKFDLVLMDVEMPEMDGYTAARTIRQIERTAGAAPTPLLALTAHAFQDAVQRSLEAGFTAHLSKPIRRLALLEAIATFAPEGRAGPRPRKIHVTVDTSLRDIVPGYLEKRRKDAMQAVEALGIGDLTAVRRLGHNLRGTGEAYGFPALSEIGAVIEDGAKAGNGDLIRSKLDELVRYLDQVEWRAANDIN
jgi:response regulator RpfG family c-di-GMP phosphodiesterase